MKSLDQVWYITLVINQLQRPTLIIFLSPHKPIIQLFAAALLRLVYHKLFMTWQTLLLFGTD